MWSKNNALGREIMKKEYFFYSNCQLLFGSSNSPFWYCNAGMNYVVGPGWRDQWDVVITSAGKPAFYTEDNRPFREVDIGTGKVKFKQVSN